VGGKSGFPLTDTIYLGGDAVYAHFNHGYGHETSVRFYSHPVYSTALTGVLQTGVHSLRQIMMPSADTTGPSRSGRRAKNGPQVVSHFGRDKLAGLWTGLASFPEG